MAKTKLKTAKKVVKNDIYDHLTNIKNALAETTDGMKGRAHEMVSDLLEDLQERRDNYQEYVEDFIVDKPFKAVGVAVIAGILISKIIL